VSELERERLRLAKINYLRCHGFWFERLLKSNTPLADYGNVYREIKESLVNKTIYELYPQLKPPKNISTPQ